MEHEVNERKKRTGLTEAEIGDIMESLTEMFDETELQDDRLMMKELRYFLGLNDKDLCLILEGARDLAKLHGHRTPLWALPFKGH
jgi:hypothetical protein